VDGVPRKPHRDAAPLVGGGGHRPPAIGLGGRTAAGANLHPAGMTVPMDPLQLGRPPSSHIGASAAAAAQASPGACRPGLIVPAGQPEPLASAPAAMPAAAPRREEPDAQEGFFSGGRHPCCQGAPPRSRSSGGLFALVGTQRTPAAAATGAPAQDQPPQPDSGWPSRTADAASGHPVTTPFAEAAPPSASAPVPIASAGLAVAAAAQQHGVSLPLAGHGQTSLAFTRLLQQAAACALPMTGTPAPPPVSRAATAAVSAPQLSRLTSVPAARSDVLQGGLSIPDCPWQPQSQSQQLLAAPAGAPHGKQQRGLEDSCASPDQNSSPQEGGEVVLGKEGPPPPGEENPCGESKDPELCAPQDSPPPPPPQQQQRTSGGSTTSSTGPWRLVTPFAANLPAFDDEGEGGSSAGALVGEGAPSYMASLLSPLVSSLPPSAGATPEGPVAAGGSSGRGGARAGSEAAPAGSGEADMEPPATLTPPPHWQQASLPVVSTPQASAALCSGLVSRPRSRHTGASLSSSFGHLPTDPPTLQRAALAAAGELAQPDPEPKAALEVAAPHPTVLPSPTQQKTAAQAQLQQPLPQPQQASTEQAQAEAGLLGLPPVGRLGRDQQEQQRTAAPLAALQAGGHQQQHLQAPLPVIPSGAEVVGPSGAPVAAALTPELAMHLAASPLLLSLMVQPASPAPPPAFLGAPPPDAIAAAAAAAVAAAAVAAPAALPGVGLAPAAQQRLEGASNLNPTSAGTWPGASGLPSLSILSGPPAPGPGPVAARASWVFGSSGTPVACAPEGATLSCESNALPVPGRGPPVAAAGGLLSGLGAALSWDDRESLAVASNRPSLDGGVGGGAHAVGSGCLAGGHQIVPCWGAAMPPPKELAPAEASVAAQATAAAEAVAAATAEAAAAGDASAASAAAAADAAAPPLACLMCYPPALTEGQATRLRGEWQQSRGNRLNTYF
jgi:hypothetical protein